MDNRVNAKVILIYSYDNYERNMEETLKILIKMVENLSFKNGEMRAAINFILLSRNIELSDEMRAELLAIAND